MLSIYALIQFRQFVVFTCLRKESLLRCCLDTVFSFLTHKIITLHASTKMSDFEVNSNDLNHM